MPSTAAISLDALGAFVQPAASRGLSDEPAVSTGVSPRASPRGDGLAAPPLQPWDVIPPGRTVGEHLRTEFPHMFDVVRATIVAQQATFNEQLTALHAAARTQQALCSMPLARSALPAPYLALHPAAAAAAHYAAALQAAAARGAVAPPSGVWPAGVPPPGVAALLLRAAADRTTRGITASCGDPRSVASPTATTVGGAVPGAGESRGRCGSSEREGNSSGGGSTETRLGGSAGVGVTPGVGGGVGGSAGSGDTGGGTPHHSPRAGAPHITVHPHPHPHRPVGNPTPTGIQVHRPVARLVGTTGGMSSALLARIQADHHRMLPALVGAEGAPGTAGHGSMAQSVDKTVLWRAVHVIPGRQGGVGGSPEGSPEGDACAPGGSGDGSGGNASGDGSGDGSGGGSGGGSGAATTMAMVTGGTRGSSGAGSDVDAPAEGREGAECRGVDASGAGAGGASRGVLAAANAAASSGAVTDAQDSARRRRQRERRAQMAARPGVASDDGDDSDGRVSCDGSLRSHGLTPCTGGTGACSAKTEATAVNASGHRAAKAAKLA